ncbi:hypothetical protein ANCDUO_27275, partial [Ancylostoma duodenale]
VNAKSLWADVNSFRDISKSFNQTFPRVIRETYGVEENVTENISVNVEENMIEEDHSCDNCCLPGPEGPTGEPGRPGKPGIP